MEGTRFLKEPVGGKSVVGKIVDNITNAIINGELKPGDKIPTEGELSEAMGVGRNSVREAIKILEAYGVVHIKRAEGTFVSQEYDSKMLYPILYGIILQKDSTNQIVDLRKVIDVGILHLAVAKLAAQEMPAHRLSRIEEALERLKAEILSPEPQVKNVHDADVAFHMAIVDLTGNTMLQGICNYVDKITRRSRMMAMDQIISEGAVEKFLEMHQKLADLLKTCDSSQISQIVEEHYQYWANVKE